MADLLRPGLNVGRRRTIIRLVPGAPGRVGKNSADKLGSDHVQDSNRHLQVKLGNSYHMKPQDCEKFQAWRVEKMMMEVLTDRLKDFTYDPATCQSLAKDMASDIQSRVKDFRWHRYRLVCQVTIGQQTQQGMEVASRCVWDHSLDTYAAVTYNNKSVFAVAQCYGIYYE